MAINLFSFGAIKLRLFFINQTSSIINNSMNLEVVTSLY